MRKHPVNMEFINLLFKKWEQSGLSQRAFGRKLGFRDGFLTLWFNGKRGMTLPTAVHLANELGIDLGKFQKRFSRFKLPIDIPKKRNHQNRVYSFRGKTFSKDVGNEAYLKEKSEE